VCWASPVCCCAVLPACALAQRTAGAAGTRPSLRPLGYEGGEIKQSSGEAPRGRVRTSVAPSLSSPAFAGNDKCYLERSVASHSVIASAATCPPKPLAKAEAIQNLSAAGFWIASSQELLATTRRRERALLFALVSRTQRSVLPAMRSTVRFDDALQSRGPSICAPYHVALGAGSAQQRHKRVYARLRCAMALQLGRNTRDQGPRLIPSPPFSTSQCLLMSVSCLSLGKDRNDCHAGRDAATIDWRQAMALKAAATAGLNEGPVTWLR